eukprot:PhM_4_TR3093/c2_g2_i1/m.104468
MFRGTTQVRISTSSCDFATRTNYAYKGTCHTIDDVHQQTGATTTRALFDAATVPDLIASDAVYSAKAFKVWSDVALCGSYYAVTPANNVATKVGSPTSTVLELEGVDSVANYHAVIRTITVTSCAQHADIVDEYTFQWHLTPDGVVQFLDPATNEPHFYQHFTCTRVS